MIKWKMFDSLNKWWLKWGVGDGKLRGGAFYKLKEGFSTECTSILNGFQLKNTLCRIVTYLSQIHFKNYLCLFAICRFVQYVTNS